MRRSNLLLPLVVDRGIEPLCQDSNPRYGNPYGSLANCWFQPLTHPSKRTLEFETLGLSPQMRVQSYNLFFNPANISPTFFKKSYLKATTSFSS